LIKEPLLYNNSELGVECRLQLQNELFTKKINFIAIPNALSVVAPILNLQQIYHFKILAFVHLGQKSVFKNIVGF